MSGGADVRKGHPGASRSGWRGPAAGWSPQSSKAAPRQSLMKMRGAGGGAEGAAIPARLPRPALEP
eukprot:2321959-Lingulodinium_polyedra.AAC.1